MFNLLRFFFPSKNFLGQVVLLDRDGTINVDKGYLNHPSEIEIEEQATMGLLKMKEAGLDLVVFTNQSGIGRGYYNSNDLLVINNQIDNLLMNENPEIYIERYFFCPHTPEEKCKCRKPKSGMFKQFQKAYPEKKVIVMIGDKFSDISMFKREKIPTILVRTGEGKDTEAKLKAGVLKYPPNLAYIADNLNEVADFILAGKLEEFAKKL